MVIVVILVWKRWNRKSTHWLTEWQGYLLSCPVQLKRAHRAALVLIPQYVDHAITWSTLHCRISTPGKGIRAMFAMSTHSKDFYTGDVDRACTLVGGIIISHLKSFVYGQGVLLVSSWAMVAWWRFIMMLMMPWEGRHTHNNLQRLQQKIVLSKIKTLTRFGYSLMIEYQKMKLFNINVLIFLCSSELKH